MKEQEKPAGAIGGLFDITVVRWRPYEKGGAFLGVLIIDIAQKIRINNIEILRFGGPRSRSIKLPKEQTLEFVSKNVEREFEAAVLAALDRYLKKRGLTLPPPMRPSGSPVAEIPEAAPGSISGAHRN